MTQIRSFYANCAVIAVLMSTVQFGCQSLGQRFGKNGENARASSDTLSQANVADEQVKLAQSLEKQRKADEAMRVYAQVAANHSLPLAYHRLAVLHDQRGEFDKSITAYKKALEKDPRNAELLCDVGYSYYLQRRWAESEHFLTSALAQSPQSPRARNNHGLLLARLGRVEEALHQFSLAGCREPEARVNLAFAMTLEDNTIEAQRQLELALKRDRNCRPARELLATIGSSENVASVVPPAKTRSNEVSVSPPLEPSAPVRLSEPLEVKSVNVSHTAVEDGVRNDDSLFAPRFVEPDRGDTHDTSEIATVRDDDRFRIPATTASQTSPVPAVQAEPAVQWKSAIEPAIEPPRFQ